MGEKDLTRISDASGMVDVTDKPDMRRIACARGAILLSPSTIQAVRQLDVQKGDVLSTARVAALLAVKDTGRSIPMCHPIPVTAVKVDFELDLDSISSEVKVTSVGKTGVEMEALCGVTAALLTIWDMVKSLEKDPSGNYPNTRIIDVRVVEKLKLAI